jgi:hypothetical protein
MRFLNPFQPGIWIALVCLFAMLGDSAKAQQSRADYRVAADACVIDMKSRKPVSTFHNLEIPPSDYPARLECFIGEISRRTEFDGKCRTVYYRRVLIIHGEKKPLMAFCEWIKKHGKSAGREGFDGTLELMREVLKDRPRSFSVDYDGGGQASNEMPFDEFVKERLPRFFDTSGALPVLPGTPEANDPELRKSLSIADALWDALRKQLMTETLIGSRR